MGKRRTRAYFEIGAGGENEKSNSYHTIGVADCMDYNKGVFVCVCVSYFDYIDVFRGRQQALWMAQMVALQMVNQ